MGRRGNNEGSISRRKDGRWIGRYTVHTADGPKQRAVYGMTRAEAAEKLTKAMANRDGGIVYDTGKLTLADYLHRWLADSVKDTVRQRTYERYESLVRVHIAPTLGRVKLKNLTPAHVRGLCRAKLDEGLAPRTVQYIHRTLSKALKQAVSDGLIPRNAAGSVKPPQPRTEEIRPLDREQVRAFLEAVSGDRLEALYVVAITAGLRAGELLGLKWEDGDLEVGMPQVRSTPSDARSGRIFEAPPSGKGRRLRLTRKATEALRGHRKRQLEEKLRLGTLWQDNGL